MSGDRPAQPVWHPLDGMARHHVSAHAVPMTRDKTHQTRDFSLDRNARRDSGSAIKLADLPAGEVFVLEENVVVEVGIHVN